MTLTGWQIREARQLAGLSQIDLATTAAVSFAIVVRAEVRDGPSMIERRDLNAIQRALEATGVDFVQEDDGIGVQLRVGDP